MKNIPTFFVFFFFFLFFSSATSTKFNFCTAPPCNSTLLALADIANAFENTYLLKKYWKVNTDYCFWIFINCNEFKNVTTINVNKKKMMGTISPSFSNLTFLEFLILDHNNFTGPIPEGLTKLTRLRVLDLSSNNLTGPIPKFSTSVEFDAKDNPHLGEISPSMPPTNGGY